MNNEKKINNIEGYCLSIVQWSISEELSEVLNGKPVFITQVFISDSVISENNTECTIKTFVVKIHFTTLYEKQFDKSGHVICCPSMEGKISFEKIAKTNYFYWTPCMVDLSIRNYPGVSFKHFHYSKTEKFLRENIFKRPKQKRKRFEDFFQKFSRNAFPLGISITQER